jgi:hypothetical protein
MKISHMPRLCARQALNTSAHTDKQHQIAASRRALPTGDLQR